MQNLSLFTPVPTVLSASQAITFADFSLTPRVSSTASSFPVEWSPSPPPPKRTRQPLTTNNPFPLTNPALLANYRGGTNSRIGRGGRSRGISRDIREDTNRRRKKTRDAGSIPSDATNNQPSFTPDVNNTSVNKKERQKKKSQGRVINAQEKLVLFCECCEHASKYKPQNKLEF